MTQTNAPVISDFDIQNLRADNQQLSQDRFDSVIRTVRPNLSPLERRDLGNTLMAAVNETDQRRMPQKIETALNSLMSAGMTRAIAANFLTTTLSLETEMLRYLEYLVQRGQLNEARELANRHRRGEFNNLNDLGRYIQQHDSSYYQRFQENIKQFSDMIKALNGRIVPHPLHNETALAANTQARLNQLAQQAAAMDRLKEIESGETEELVKKQERRRREAG